MGCNLSTMDGSETPREDPEAPWQSSRKGLLKTDSPAQKMAHCLDILDSHIGFLLQ